MRCALLVACSIILSLIVFSTYLHIEKTKLEIDLDTLQMELSAQSHIVVGADRDLRYALLEREVFKQVLNNMMAELAKISGHRIDINQLVISTVYTTIEDKVKLEGACNEHSKTVSEGSGKDSRN